MTGKRALELVRCEPYSCDLTLIACAARYRKANVGKTRVRFGLDHTFLESAHEKALAHGACRGCAVGRERAEVVAPVALDGDSS